MIDGKCIAGKLLSVSFNTERVKNAREVRPAAARTLRKSLHRKDLRPNGQHPDEQRKRRQGGGFFDDGPDHDPLLATGQNGNIVPLLFQSQGQMRCCPVLGAKFPECPNLPDGAS